MDLFSKVFYAGVGATVTAAQVVSEVGKKIALGATQSEAEGRRVVGDIVRQTQEVKDAVEKVVNDGIDTLLTKQR